MRGCQRQEASLTTSATGSVSIDELRQNVYDAMNDDFNTPIVLSHLFEGVRIINSANDGKEQLSEEDKNKLQTLMKTMVYDILGLKEESAGNNDKLDGLMRMVLDIRNQAKTAKDFKTSDLIRDELKKIGLDTARSVLTLTRDDLIRRTDLEEETIDHVLQVLNQEFE